MPHVVNLVAQRLLMYLRKVPAAKLAQISAGENPAELRMDILDKLAIMVRKIRRSPQQIESFRARCIMKSLEPRTPIIDVVTRWNSTFEMLEFARNYKEVFRSHALDQEWSSLVIGSDDWIKLEPLLSVLGAFKTVSEMQSGSSYATINRVYPCYEYLLSSMNRAIETAVDPDLSEQLIAAREKLNHYYDRTAICVNIGTLVDPSKKLVWFQKYWTGDLEQFVQVVLSQAEETFDYYCAKYPQYMRSSNGRAANCPLEPDMRLFRSFDRMEPVESGDQPNQNELEEYLASPPEALDDGEAIGWWKRKQKKFPLLSRIARDYLAIAASSVPCEQVFSSGVDLVTPNRNRLLPESISMTMLLKHWLKRSQSLLHPKRRRDG
jgi:hypothetical protein